MGVLQFLRRFLRRESAPGKETCSLPRIDLRRLEQALGYTVRNPQLFREALVHRSYLQVPEIENVVSNERLEFLGDAILNHIITELIFEEYPRDGEGDLTKLRSRLVNRKALAAYAQVLNLWDFLLLSNGAARSSDKGVESILADGYEAMVAAICLDGGYKAARSFVMSHVRATLDQGLVRIHDENFKSQLLEHAQAQGMAAPRYSVLIEEGPDHDRTYTVEVRVAGNQYGIGVGKNKKDAEQAAAREALRHIGVPRQAGKGE